ncbi:MAG TPA: STAS domain-containing protein [bacterium]|nr:STAS domain-containing protein [bacterium]
MSGTTPITRFGDTLIVTVREALHDAAATELQEEITDMLERSQPAALLIDVSVLDVVDSFMGRLLNDIAAMARLMGARTVIAGIRPQVAITLIELGLRLRGVETVLSVEQGLARLGHRNGTRRGR